MMNISIRDYMYLSNLIRNIRVIYSKAQKNSISKKLLNIEAKMLFFIDEPINIANLHLQTIIPSMATKVLKADVLQLAKLCYYLYDGISIQASTS